MKRLLLALMLCLAPALASAQNAAYDLEMMQPKPAGSSRPSQMDADNYWFYAYPGIQYNRQIVCMGGKFPYVYTLSGAPAWMTVNSSTGIVSGTPTNTTTDDDASITATCTDVASDTASQTFGVDVQTAKFRFASGSGSDSNDGLTPSTPFRTLDHVQNFSGNNTICYFRNGTYDTVGMGTASSGRFLRVEWNGDAGPHCGQWVAYPGESPVIDGRYLLNDVATPLIRFTNANIVVDGLRFTRFWNKAIDTVTLNNEGGIVRRNTFDNIGEGADSQNSSALFTTVNGFDVGLGLAFFDNICDALDRVTCFKTYTQNKMVIARTTIRNSLDALDAAIAIKGDHERVEIRETDCSNYGVQSSPVDNSVACIGGNMQTAHNVEWRYNNLRRGGNGKVILINESAAPVPEQPVNTISGPNINRNTFMGRIDIRSQTASGPWRFERNVIVNSDVGTGEVYDGIHFNTYTDASVTSSTNDFKCTPSAGCVNANGLLIGSALTNHGPDSAMPKGHMLGVGAPGDPAPTVTSAAPNSGTTAGGTVITITGTGFTATPTATVGGVPCIGPSFLSSTALTCTTGAHSAGAVTIIVTNPDAQTGSAASAFTYTTPGTFVRIPVRFDN